MSRIVIVSTAPPYSGRGVYSLYLYREVSKLVSDLTFIYEYRFQSKISRSTVLLKLRPFSSNKTIFHLLNEGLAMVSSFVYGKKVITIHDILSDKVLIKILKRNFDAVIAVSENVEKSIRATKFKKPIYTIPLGVDANLFRPLSKGICRKILGLPEKKPIIFTSDGDRRKHVDKVLDVIYTITNNYRTDVHLLVLGKPSKFILNKAKSLGVLDRVKFIYNVPYSIVVYAYNSADLMLYLSTYDTGPLVILEAMACALPILSTPVGSVPTFLKGFEGLLIADDNDIKSISEKVLLMLSNEETLKSYGLSLRERAIKEFSWKKVAERTLRVYEHVISCLS